MIQLNLFHNDFAITIKTLKSSHFFHKLPTNTRHKKVSQNHFVDSFQQFYYLIFLCALHSSPIFHSSLSTFGSELKSLRDHANFVVIKDAWEGGRRNWSFIADVLHPPGEFTWQIVYTIHTISYNPYKNCMKLYGLYESCATPYNSIQKLYRVAPLHTISIQFHTISYNFIRKLYESVRERTCLNGPRFNPNFRQSLFFAFFVEKKLN